MMNEKWSGARARYEAAPVPEELNFAVAAAVAAALAALSWFDKAGTPEYIEIYSDDEDAF